MKEGAARYGVGVHAYVLMTNHYHILASPADEGAIPAMIQMLGRLYVRYINKKYGRSGTLWEGRYKTSLIDADDYLFSCMRYIENNPVRARMTRKPGTYPWSSYGRNAEGGPDPLVQSHTLYTGLAKTPQGRSVAYGRLFDMQDNPEEDEDMIRKATQSGWVAGGEAFRERVSRKTKQRAGPLPRGGDRRRGNAA